MASEFNWAQTISSFILGGVTGLLWPYVKDKIHETKQLKLALEEMHELFVEIEEAVAHVPHIISNKDKWVKRLEDCASRNRESLGRLGIYISKIAFKLEDNKFSHDEGKPEYCCDELRKDLYLVKLVLVEKFNRKKHDETLEKQYLFRYMQVQSIKNSVQRWLDPENFQVRLDNYYNEWKKGTLKVENELAMAGYINKD